jgi:SAM-dependent methyltransferase
MLKTRFDNARRLIPARRSVLDYGCGAGEFLQYIAGDISQGVGIDLDRSLIAGATEKSGHRNIAYICGNARWGLPFPDSTFDVVTALGVLEHVGPEKPYLEEFYRVLRAEGHLVLDVPAKGPFRWADIGNVKYNFPRLHKWFYIHVARQPEYYHQHFGSGANMFGQFSREAREHRHYGKREISHLLGSEFTIVEHIEYGLFFELIQLVEIVATKALRWDGNQWFARLLEQDCKVPSFLASANMIVLARSTKIDQAESRA